MEHWVNFNWNIHVGQFQLIWKCFKWVSLNQTRIVRIGQFRVDQIRFNYPLVFKTCRFHRRNGNASAEFLRRQGTFWFLKFPKIGFDHDLKSWISNRPKLSEDFLLWVWYWIPFTLKMIIEPIENKNQKNGWNWEIDIKIFSWSSPGSDYL